MRHKSSLVSLSLMCVLLELLTIQSPANSSSNRPNIILIMADDMGWGDTSSSGNPVQQTPHLDQMVEDGIRVPGIVVLPRLGKKRVISAPACTSDIYPTLVDLVFGENPRQPEDGVSLLSLISGRQSERGISIAFGTSPKHRVILGDRYKLHSFQDAGETRWELYDLILDRGEMMDISAQKPEVVKRLKDELDDWQQSCDQSLKDLYANDGLVTGWTK